MIQHEVHRLVGFGTGEIDLDHGDAGWFGPGSTCWQVHGDFTAMMIGGVAALMMQMLHPGALAGVWDHSDFRRDMLGRLRRTAQFIAGTTYGSAAEAERLVARVRAIHGRVRGFTEDGTPYSADDPALLTWVHVAEVTSFLAAWRRYRAPAMPGEAQDRYLAETALIARRLGAQEVPDSRRAVATYLAAVRPLLRHGERTATVAAALFAQPTASPALAPVRTLMLQAGVELLPDWAVAMHGRALPPIRRSAIRLGARGMGSVLRWALRDGSAARARRRVGAPP